MNTFELKAGDKERIEEMRSIGERLWNNYDLDVLASDIGAKVMAITGDLLKGNLKKFYLEAMKDYASDLCSAYDTEVLAHVLAKELDLLLQGF